MNKLMCKRGILAAVLLLTATRTYADALGTSFAYEGQLKKDGVPVTGPVDFQFTLFPAASGGTSIPTQERSNQEVTNGLFQVVLDFGDIFSSGQIYWLGIAVAIPAGSGNFETMTPRYELTPVPYALYAKHAPPGNTLNAADGNPQNVLFVDNAGKVGIGTTAPRAPLDIRGGENDGTTASLMITGSNTAQTLLLDGNEIDAKADGLFLNNNTNQNVILANGGGNVGIGTTSPSGQLEVSSASTYITNLSISNTTSNQEYFLQVNGSGIAGHAGHFEIWAPGFNVFTATPTGNVGIGTVSPGAKFEVSGGEVRLPGGSNPPNWPTHFNYAGDGRNYIRGTTIIADTGGNVGIGTSNPAAKLEIAAQDGLNIRGYQPFLTLTDTNASNARSLIQGYNGGIAFHTNTSIGGSAAMLLDNNGNLGVGTDAPSRKLDVNGTARVQILEITGADLAEKFPVSEKVEPGMVVEIDPEHAGKLRLSRGAYNRRVAGVVSGAGDLSVGVVLGHLPGHEDAPPIAMSGRVWVRCDASNGPIEPGDLLTTSSTLGVAMKADDYVRAQGASIGKAMGSLRQGEQGLILVLVNLQ